MHHKKRYLFGLLLLSALAVVCAAVTSLPVRSRYTTTTNESVSADGEIIEIDSQTDDALNTITQSNNEPPTTGSSSSVSLTPVNTNSGSQTSDNAKKSNNKNSQTRDDSSQADDSNTETGVDQGENTDSADESKDETPELVKKPIGDPVPADDPVNTQDQEKQERVKEGEGEIPKQDQDDSRFSDIDDTPAIVITIPVVDQPQDDSNDSDKQNNKYKEKNDNGSKNKDKKNSNSNKYKTKNDNGNNDEEVNGPHSSSITIEFRGRKKSNPSVLGASTEDSIWKELLLDFVTEFIKGL